MKGFHFLKSQSSILCLALFEKARKDRWEFFLKMNQNLLVLRNFTVFVFSFFLKKTLLLGPVAWSTLLHFHFFKINKNTTKVHFKRHLITCLNTSLQSPAGTTSITDQLWWCGCRLNSKLWFRSTFRHHTLKPTKDLKFIWKRVGPKQCKEFLGFQSRPQSFEILRGTL